MKKTIQAADFKKKTFVKPQIKAFQLKTAILAGSVSPTKNTTPTKPDDFEYGGTI